MRVRREGISHGDLRVGMILAAVGGFLDAYTFVLKGGVFANAQTGNVVLVAVHAALFQWIEALRYLLPVIAFAAGVIVSEVIKHLSGRRTGKLWPHAVLLLEAVILGIFAFISSALPDFIVTVTVSFVCAVQVSSFRILDNSPYCSTMITGNLRSACDALYAGLMYGDKGAGLRFRNYMLIILIFGAGAVVSVMLSRYMGDKSLFLCSVLLCLASFLMVFSAHRKN